VIRCREGRPRGQRQGTRTSSTTRPRLAQYSLVTFSFGSTYWSSTSSAARLAAKQRPAPSNNESANSGHSPCITVIVLTG